MSKVAANDREHRPEAAAAEERAAAGPSARPLSPRRLSHLLSLPGNDRCAECTNPSRPDWASVTYGILLCLDCAGAHRGLGVHLSFVRSLTMDDWTEGQYERMVAGGNGRWREYWEAKGGDNGGEPELRKRIRAKYESNVARAYREALLQNAGAPGPLSESDAPAAPSLSSLPEESPPRFDDLLRRQAWPFVLSMVSSRKSLINFSVWGVLGISCAYGAHWWGIQEGTTGNNVTSSLPSVNPSTIGQMGASLSESNTYYDLLAVGILAMTAGIPYIMLRRFAQTVARGLSSNRQEAFKSARNLLIERISQGRAQRLARCDVYYPAIREGAEPKAKCGLVFYPGALVDRTAYAPIATRLSEAGILVAVANLEPYRVVANLSDYPLREEVMHIVSDAVLLSNQGAWTVDEWSIGGHSMGGHIAIAAVANEMSSTMKKVVLWGVLSHPDPGAYPMKQSLRETKGVSALVVNGSEDKIATSTVYSGKDKEQKFWNGMPPRAPPGDRANLAQGYSQHVVIQGGNHSGCAHYGPQTFPLPDGVRTITLEQQQEQVAETTVDFLLGRAAKQD